jgi:hypothetical protein
MAPDRAAGDDLMADLSDVENAVVTEVAGALYPNGIGEPSAIGVSCRVYRGWPAPAALNSDLAIGIVNVTVFPASKPDEVLDCYFDTEYANVVPASLMVYATGDRVRFSGLVRRNEVVGLLVDGVPFVYEVQGGDTIERIAANIAAMVRGSRIAILSGSMLTIPGAVTLTARIVTNGTVFRQIRRQRRELMICCWCPTPTLRDSVSALVDLGLMASPFIDLGDGTETHVRYVSTQIYDQSLNALLYRRDLCYSFGFTMIRSSVASVMLIGSLIRNADTTFV